MRCFHGCSHIIKWCNYSLLSITAVKQSSGRCPPTVTLVNVGLFTFSQIASCIFGWVCAIICSDAPVCVLSSAFSNLPLCLHCNFGLVWRDVMGVVHVGTVAGSSLLGSGCEVVWSSVMDVVHVGTVAGSSQQGSCC